jgi:hypothetical protein
VGIRIFHSFLLANEVSDALADEDGAGLSEELDDGDGGCKD